MQNKIPKNPVASDELIGNLIFEARQRKQWGDYCRRKGRPGESDINFAKSEQAVKSLRSLGYTEEIFN